jgi:endonuclease YncB( thermonuclease family)
VRLHGIDGPELTQQCEAAGRSYPCGHDAAKHLAHLVRGKSAACSERARDRYDRTIAVCTVDGRDLAAAMVDAGHAVAFVRYSQEYVPHEKRAQAARVGLWRGTFAMPWEWRAERR